LKIENYRDAGNNASSLVRRTLKCVFYTFLLILPESFKPFGKFCFWDLVLGLITLFLHPESYAL